MSFPMRLAAAALVWLATVPAAASVVADDYLMLSDGTELHYTLTLPSTEGRFPVVLQYDPYDAGVTSDPTWNDAGYAMLGVNMRGTGCSRGTFQPVRADIWGADGAEVVDWVTRQDWSTGSVGMIGYSFTGVSQLATAAFAGKHLKAIAPGNVFLDFYRDSIYPGGIHNGWIPLWILAGRAYFLGAPNVQHALSDPRCAQGLAEQALPNAAQGLDTQLHPFANEFWARQPSSLLERVKIPVLGCVNWQDSTIYSRAGDAFREHLNPATTWLVGGNGAHADCPISRARLVRFFDRYLKGQNNGWEATPHVLLVHEQAGESSVRESLDDNAGAWQTAFADWSDMEAAIQPVPLYLHEGGRLDQTPPLQPEAADSYDYPTPSANTPADWVGINRWGNPVLPGGALIYTTPALAQDAEFLGGGSADLWIASSATDSDVQITLSEQRPDGQETHVQNGWLRLSHRRLDLEKSTPLRPWHTHQESDSEPLTPGQPVLARIELLPFNHVFRAGSAIRLAIDAPGGWFQILPIPATNSIHYAPATASRLVLGWMPAGRAQAPMPACGSLLNQPCRENTAPVPEGSITIKGSAVSGSASGQARLNPDRGGGCAVADGGTFDPLWLIVLLITAAWIEYVQPASRRKKSAVNSSPG